METENPEKPKVRLGMIQAELGEITRDIITDAEDGKVAFGPAEGPVTVDNNGPVYHFGYAVKSKHRGSVFFGAIEMREEDAKEEHGSAAHQINIIRLRMMRFLGKTGMFVHDCLNRVEFGRVCETLWPCEQTAMVRKHFEDEEEKNAPKKPVKDKFESFRPAIVK